jgi:hypothetical protein
MINVNLDSQSNFYQNTENDDIRHVNLLLNAKSNYYSEPEIDLDHQRAIVQNMEDKYMRHLIFLLNNSMIYCDRPGINLPCVFKPGFMTTTTADHIEKIIKCLNDMTSKSIWIENDIYVLFKSRDYDGDGMRIFENIVLVGRKSTILKTHPFPRIEELIIDSNKYILPKYIITNDAMHEYTIDPKNKLKWIDYNNVILFKNFLWFQNSNYMINNNTNANTQYSLYS